MKTLILCISIFGGVLSQYHGGRQHFPYNHQPQQNLNLPGCPTKQTYLNHRTIAGSKCYEFILVRPEDWATALRDCRNKGGHLLTVENSTEEAFVMRNLQTLNYHGKGVWIGLHDINHEGHFVWESGKPLTFTHWEKGQPDDNRHFQDQDCVLLYVPQRNDFHTYQDGTPGWHDQHCKDILFEREDDGWVCEYDIMTSPKHTTSKPMTQTSNLMTSVAPKHKSTLPAEETEPTGTQETISSTEAQFIIGK